MLCPQASWSRVATSRGNHPDRRRRRSPGRLWGGSDGARFAFRRLGGSPRIVILDNLREAVIIADIYDPTLNPLFRDVLAHYGVVAMPCRIKDPDRKDQASYCTSLDMFDAS